MNQPKPIIDNATTEALVNLIEECAEVSKEVTKALRFGLDHRYRDPVKRAREYLGQEIGQLRAVADILCNAGQVDPLDIQRGYVEKMEKLKTWSNLPHEWLALSTARPEAREPMAWIATHESGVVQHFAKADGWQIEVVQTTPSPREPSDG